MSADDWADLARLAQTATPGPWRAALLDGVTYEDGSSSHRGGIYPGTAPGPPPLFLTYSIDKRDAEFIAAADPATILRLIGQLREAREDYHEAVTQVGALAARLAAVEALANEWQRFVATSLLAEDLRAVLSAAPTDTTKEN